MIYAIGIHSYITLSLPLGASAVEGYINIPPYFSVRWTSATMEPIYRPPYALPCFLDLTYSFTAVPHLSSYPSLMEYIFPRGLTFISGSVKTNSPIDGSNMNPLTPCPVDKTIIVALPYKAYPAATICLPDWRASPGAKGPSWGFLKIAKMEPIDTRQSMFELPSRGSKLTMYFPCLSVSTSISLSFSWNIYSILFNHTFMIINTDSKNLWVYTSKLLQRGESQSPIHELKDKQNYSSISTQKKLLPLRRVNRMHRRTVTCW